MKENKTVNYNKAVSITIRINRDLADRVIALARADQRSVTQIASRAILIGVPALEKQFQGSNFEGLVLNETEPKLKRQ